MSVSNATEALKAISADLVALTATEEDEETLKTDLSTLEATPSQRHSLFQTCLHDYHEKSSRRYLKDVAKKF